MKKLLIITIVLLSVFSFSCKKEQKVIFVADSISFKSGYSFYCQEDCKKVSESLEDYLNDGWKITSSIQKNKNIDNTCTCIGSEYIIEK
jgi:hypothetical protein